jgi:hypothetical protein
MSVRYLTVGILFTLSVSLFSCGQLLDVDQLQGNWKAVSADVHDPRENHQILEETKKGMIQSDTMMMFSFEGENARVKIGSQVGEESAKSRDFQGIWQYRDNTQDSLIVQHGDIIWRFKVSEFSPNRMRLVFRIPMMPRNQIHEVEFVKQ